MSRLSRFGGRLLVGLGLLVALYPLLSTYRLTGEVVDELPEISGVEARADRHRFRALFDEDFVLATRTYRSTTTDVVRNALSQHGFDGNPAGYEQWASKECCGDYDAVLVNIAGVENEPGDVLAVITVADGDIQLALGVFAGIGLMLALAGLLIAHLGSAPAADEREPPERHGAPGRYARVAVRSRSTRSQSMS